MKSKLGIFQGRLSPSIEGKVQFFPKESWRDEFPIAKSLGFELIEWVLDKDSILDNPILSEEGLLEIKSLSDKDGIQVFGICTDNYMVDPFVDNTEILTQLITSVGKAGVEIIEIPLLGASLVENTDQMKITAKKLNELESICTEYKMGIALEVGLDTSGVLDFFEYVKNPFVSVNYDTGNSAYWNFDQLNEISNYSHLIGNIHIKDCTPELYSVPLGKGNVDFPAVFKLLKLKGYKKHFILQTARGENDINVAKEYYEFITPLINELNNESRT
ncbi:MAG: TIM barrel protein [Bacteriovoracaceae bacterium]|jgi:L-ribulose-5-phosphate 3-epimerase|nr:TIM barrel protein [Bacteriovoracaceae bacterium]